MLRKFTVRFLILIPALLLSGLSSAQDFTVIALPDTQNEAKNFPRC